MKKQEYKVGKSTEQLKEAMKWKNLFPGIQYYCFPPVLLKQPGFSWRLAGLLAFIINKYRYHNANPETRRRHHEWYYCKEKELAEKLLIPPGSQYVLLKKLVRMGLIEMKRKGNPSKRFIRLNVQKLRNMMEDKS